MSFGRDIAMGVGTQMFGAFVVVMLIAFALGLGVGLLFGAFLWR